jgi:hypothetical protein
MIAITSGTFKQAAFSNRILSISSPRPHRLYLLTSDPDPHRTTSSPAMSAPITFPHPTYKLAPLSRDADDETNTFLDGLWTRDTDHGNTMRNLVWILQQQHDPFVHWERKERVEVIAEETNRKAINEHMQQRYTEKLRADFKDALDKSEALIVELQRFVEGAK